MGPIPVSEAKLGDRVFRGRPAASRAEWEAAREADAADLNRLLEAGGEVAIYVAPLWSNADAERCLKELRGFDEARVYLEIVAGDGMEEALAAIAETEWAGAALRGEGLAAFLYTAASLDLPIYVEDAPHVLRALALAIGEDLTPREIEAVLRGEDVRESDAESLERARDLIGKEETR